MKLIITEAGRRINMYAIESYKNSEVKDNGTRLEISLKSPHEHPVIAASNMTDEDADRLIIALDAFLISAGCYVYETDVFNVREVLETE